MLDEPAGSPARFVTTCIAISWPISSAPCTCLASSRRIWAAAAGSGERV